MLLISFDQFISPAEFNNIFYQNNINEAHWLVLTDIHCNSWIERPLVVYKKRNCIHVHRLVRACSKKATTTVFVTL